MEENMKKYAFAVLLLVTLISGQSFAEDPWTPRMDNGYSWMDWLSDTWQVLVSYF